MAREAAWRRQFPSPVVARGHSRWQVPVSAHLGLVWFLSSEAGGSWGDRTAPFLLFINIVQIIIIQIIVVQIIIIQMFIIIYYYSNYQLSRADCSKEIKADISIKSFSRNPRKSSGGKPTVNVCLLTTSLLSWWTMICFLTWLMRMRMKRVKERRCFYIINSFSSGWNWFLIL